MEFCIFFYKSPFVEATIILATRKKSPVFLDRLPDAFFGKERKSDFVFVGKREEKKRKEQMASKREKIRGKYDFCLILQRKSVALPAKGAYDRIGPDLGGKREEIRLSEERAIGIKAEI
ncbi:MAG: hypothetical protein IJC85_01905 [Oscillospiraceae bacterium]|nr:hypothetical protein [Oscillospiraceae bacterium]